MSLEYKLQYAERGDRPDGEHLVPLGVTRIVRDGSDVTIVATRRAAQTLAKEGSRAR